ncbi:MAG: ABC transporter ATP-binding protein [Bacteroidales bacterium]|nr:ABC transporter ATP-binding protein [Bacteroidales bacterium]
MSGNKVLEIKNLCVEFESSDVVVKAVDNLCVELDRGKILGIVGESGSGKSVSALSIMQLIPKPSGRISKGEILYSFEEKIIDLRKLTEKEIRFFRGKEISMIFQEPMTSLNPVFKCGNQIIEAILEHQKISKKSAKEKVISLLKEVKLSNPEKVYQSYPHQLSGGQKQRVMIAMAMSSNPKILIADEPTTALDVSVQKDILTLVKDLQQKHGMSIIFISHDLGVIAEICDSLIVMFKGKVVESGKVNDIFNNPQHSYTKGLLACRPPLNKRLRALPTISDFLKNDEKKSFTNFIDELTISNSDRKKTKDLLFQQKPILVVNDLKKYFPLKKSLFRKRNKYFHAVDNVSFDVFPNETLGLVGESGCGKTTLGRSILRLTEIDDGKIIFDGCEINKLRKIELRKKRKDLQIIFQDPYSSLNPRISAGESILEPMRIHRIYNNEKVRKEKAIELLEKVGMDSIHFYRYPHEFSGGQRQRICIARALAVQPKFIICDESVSALDVSVQAQVLNLLNDLKKEFGLTYIFISHDLSVVKFMSDRMAVMKDGKIIEIDDADEIYYNPKTEYTKKLIEAIPKGK